MTCKLDSTVEYLPGFFNPSASQAIGFLVLPSVTLNPDRLSDYQRYSAQDLRDHTGTRVTRFLERLVTNRLDSEFEPSVSDEISVSRIRYMEKHVDSGWHRDSSRDIRYIVGLLGQGLFYSEFRDEPITVSPGDVIRIDNSAQDSIERPRHKAVSISRSRVVLVYGKKVHFDEN